MSCVNIVLIKIRYKLSIIITNVLNIRIVIDNGLFYESRYFNSADIKINVI